MAIFIGPDIIEPIAIVKNRSLRIFSTLHYHSDRRPYIGF